MLIVRRMWKCKNDLKNKQINKCIIVKNAKKKTIVKGVKVSTIFGFNITGYYGSFGILYGEVGNIHETVKCKIYGPFQVFR